MYCCTHYLNANVTDRYVDWSLHRRRSRLMAYVTPIKHTRIKLNPHRHVQLPDELFQKHFSGKSVVLGHRGWMACGHHLLQLMTEELYARVRAELQSGTIQYVKVERSK